MKKLEAWCSFLLFILFASPLPALAATCSFGAEVSSPELCSFFYYFGPESASVDPRIASRLQPQEGDRVRNLALIVGVSQYPNFPASNQLPPAAKDVANLKVFLKDKQKFDEIIVLENADASIANISYFLNDYLLSRASLFNRKVRILIAYSGHGVPQRGPFPPALVLANASSVTDVSHSYSLRHLRTSVEDLANVSFQAVALINACYGGEVFSNAMGGGQPSDSYHSGTYALTAGADDQLVYSLGGAGQGSIFFDALIKGIGAADPDWPIIVDGSNVQKGGVVRLGALSNYLDAQIEILNQRTPLMPGQPFSAPWIGPIMPSPQRARGGFFFLSPVVQEAKGFGASPPAVVATQKFTAAVSSISGRPDIKIFNAPEEYAIRGVDLSHVNREIDWQALAKAVDFVYLKVSSGARTDESFSNYWQRAGAAGLQRGAYHVLEFCTSVESQFELIRSMLPSTDDMLPFTIDVEDYSWGPQQEANCVKALGKEGARSRILQMARLVQEHYHKVPVIYGPSSTLSDLLDDRFSEFMVWLSSFTRGTSGRPNVRLVGKNPWTLWQYTEKATINGISGQSDANVFFGTRDQFEIFKLGQVNVPLAAISK